MKNMQRPKHLQKIISSLKKLPGIGQKSAERFTFQMLEWSEQELSELAQLIKTAHTSIKKCRKCSAYTDEESCSFCIPSRASKRQLCIVAHPKDCYVVEEAGQYAGLYHVLGSLLSPIDGISPENLRLDILEERLAEHQIEEVILALDASLEADTTALFFKEWFKQRSIFLSRIAFGIPMGTSMDYVDGGTLARSFIGRTKLI